MDLTNREYLKKALDKLGFKYKEATNGTLKTKNRFSSKEIADVDILVEGQGDKNFDDAFGFKLKADGSYEAVGDFYGLTTDKGERVSELFVKEEIVSSAKQAEINERLMALDFTTSETTETKQYINMSFSRWVP
jgi:hypothetical protein